MAARAGGRQETKSWAMLAYIAGDNNLSDAGLEDVRELCEVGSSRDVWAAVEIDTYGEHTGSIRYEISEPDAWGEAHWIVIRRLAEKDSGDPETVRSVVTWGLKRYPARNRLLVVWNHGSGFRSVRRDIGYDDFGSSLDMPEVESALRRAGVGPRSRIDILGFDACLMSMLEVVHHFRELARIVVGSQQTEPGDGWPYDLVLAEAKRRPERRVLARRIVETYIASYRARGTFDVTQSAIDVAKTGAAVRRLHALGDALADDFEASGEVVEAVRTSVQVFEMADYVDLVQLAEEVAAAVAVPRVRKAAAALAGAARKCVLANGRLGRGVARANGLSVWFPADDDTYLRHRAKYLRLRCNAGANPGWVRFLDRFHG
ncbi:MAG: hypothetical protein HY907_17835 [Deltaproteobacteria bacterium]|nr:hypothetical protein [Deltaproteobacteria bacterium]